MNNYEPLVLPEEPKTIPQPLPKKNPIKKDDPFNPPLPLVAPTPKG